MATVVLAAVGSLASISALVLGGLLDLQDKAVALVQVDEIGGLAIAPQAASQRLVTVGEEAVFGFGRWGRSTPSSPHRSPANG